MVSRDSCSPSHWVTGWLECMQKVGTDNGAIRWGCDITLPPQGLFPSYPHISLSADGPKAVPLVPAPIYTSFRTIAQVSSVPFSIVWLKRCPVQPQI